MIASRPYPSRFDRRPNLRRRRVRGLPVMTMAVGLLCRDGLVIGADRQITGSGYTFPECKLASVAWKNGHGIFAYSGGHDVYKDFLRAIGERFNRDLEFDDSQVRKLVKDSFASLNLGRKEQFFALFGFMLEDHGPRMLLCTPQRIVDANRCEVIGVADSPLSRSLLGRLRNVPQMISVRQADIYVVDFISQAKRYDGEFVGDGTDVYSIGIENDRTVIRVLDAGQSGSWEEKIGLAHYWQDVFFGELSDADGPMQNTELFMQRMQEFREWVGGHPIPWPKPSNPEK